MSGNALEFRLRLSRGAEFKLDVEESIPLTGITAMVGASGGGKTTLLRGLAGLERGFDGRVSFGGTVWQDAQSFVQPEDRRVGFVFQTPALFPHLTVLQNLAYGAKRREVDGFDAVLDALDLKPLLKRGVTHLSGGEARRVALGRALASNPRILFLDEPLSGLDRARRAELLPYIGRAAIEARVPALYVTHSLDEVTSLADRVLGLAGGRLTGWRRPPARLQGTVTSVTEGLMRVLVDGAEMGQGGDLTLPLMARVGEKVGLGLPPESLLISSSPPGRSDAVLQFPAEVIDGTGGLTVSAFGQRVLLPKGGPHSIGATIWLSVLRVLPRPEFDDSSVSG